MEEFRELRETRSSRVVCRSILLLEGQKRRGFVMVLRDRSKKECKVSGSRSLHSGRSWSMPEEMKTWDAAHKLCAEATS